MTATDHLAALASPACYPHAPADVRVLQTHLSVVCLAGDLVYKLKKAVTLPFVDFAPLAARRQACRDEVRLNRRLCPDVYLGTAALRRGADGEVRFAPVGDDDGGGGLADLDVAVVMRRLPQARMLDELLRVGAVAPAAIAALAAHVADFHARCERPAAAAAPASAELRARFADENFAQAQALGDGALPARLLAAVAAASRAGFARLLPTLRARASAGHVVDGHGDLHARNVCMTAPPAIYDCIEFEPRFRIADVAADVAFLAMDLRYRGAPALARAFVDAYVARSGDGDLPALLPWLCSYRAMVRAKVAAIAAVDAALPAADRDGARHSARAHLRLAATSGCEADGPRWLVLCGPPASGKSTIAAALHAATGWPVVATDAVRKQLAGIAPQQHGDAAVYTPEFTARTYATVFAAAAAATAAGAGVVVLDGNFATADQRRAAATAAGAAGAQAMVLHVDVDAATALARATERAARGGALSDADAAVTARLRAAFAPPTPAEGLPLRRCQGALTAAEAADDTLAAMLAGGGP
ncbi:MAG: AAA family ATPase [Planctomycetota bacterium]